MAKFPYGPRRKQPISWDDIWGWAIPKAVSPEHQKLAKQLLGAMLTDTDGQIGMWNATGGAPPSVKGFEGLEQKNPGVPNPPNGGVEDGQGAPAQYFATLQQSPQDDSDVPIH